MAATVAAAGHSIRSTTIAEKPAASRGGDFTRKSIPIKLQYLGDSKDSFKWDYHHFLVEALGYRQLTIALMMTADDGSTHGRSAPQLFPARQEITILCNELRRTRDPALLLELPAIMGASYTVGFHKPEEALVDGHSAFFSGIDAAPGQVIFLDPDNGFEPERSSTHKHVRYADLDTLINTIPPETVVTVFQHHRRKPFPDDFARIRERLLSGYATAIYGNSVMFVSVSASAEAIQRVRTINSDYTNHRPVKILG